MHLVLVSRIDPSLPLTTLRAKGQMTEIRVREDKQPMSILIGNLMDQAALAGVMNALYGLHLSVISVELLDEMQS